MALSSRWNAQCGVHIVQDVFRGTDSETICHGQEVVI